MKNILKELEKDPTSNFFIAKSKITTSFESGESRDEYHLYYIVEKDPPSFFSGYKNLVERKMTRAEIKHFLKNIGKYIKDLCSEDGTIYNLESNRFDKSKCCSFRQYVLDL